jgi:hypothetical protein
MTTSLERLWVHWLNSARWRALAKDGPGARVLRSPVYRKLDTARRYALTAYKAYRQPTLFQDVKTFCLFIGQVKSGGTLLGSLLDAHPNVVLADEIDALRYISAGFKRDQIFHLLLRGAKREALRGRITARRLTPYSLAVPGQWQGRHQKIKVIGDSKAGPSTRQFGQAPRLLDRLQATMATIDLRIIQVIRNPYDPISAMMVRGGRSFENAVDHYFDYCHTLANLHNRLPGSSLTAVHYEDFVRQPRQKLGELCQFVGVEAHDAYLEACTGIVKPVPDQSRQMVPWTPRWIGIVRDRISQFDFLADYTYEN